MAPTAICLCRDCHLSVRLFTRGPGNAILLPSLTPARRSSSKTRLTRLTRQTSPESPAINPTDATSPPPPRKGKAKIVFQYYHYNLEPPPKKPRRLRRMGLDGMVSYEYPQEPVKDLPGWFQSVPATPPASDNDNSWETKYLRGPGENFRGDNFRPYILRPKQTQ